LFEFKTLDEETLAKLIRRALAHPERGIEGTEVRVDDDAVAHIARYAEGDARRALNALEIALLTTPPADGVIHITVGAAAESIQRKLLHYDGAGDEHYDAASAFIKSMRGSNPDAALYWMARMLEAGEEPHFVARRMCILASEDVGNADPMALVLATSAWQACEFIGMPEARLILAQAATYLACAPKSNASYLAIGAASDDVRKKKSVAVPQHLRDGGPRGAEIGRGVGYDYPHDHEGGYVAQDYGVPLGTYYHPTDRGREAEFKEKLQAQLEQEKNK
jgi:putative ATPase